MSSSLILPGEMFPTQKPDPRDVARKAAMKWADGAKTETESKVLTALRRGGSFASAATLAAFIKCDEAATRNALNELQARQLARWGDDTLGTGGYRAYERSSGFNIA